MITHIVSGTMLLGISIMNIKSSYKKYGYDKVFKTLCYCLNPKLIVEFGILQGYSLDCFVNYSNASIEANDLFDDFPYNAADRTFIENRYKGVSNLKINKKNFYESVNDYVDNSIDILHIDIANTGDTYDFAIKNYLPKVKGIMVLEGGSEERDNVEWMLKYDRPKIQPVLKKYSSSVIITVLEDYPSLTFIKK